MSAPAIDLDALLRRLHLPTVRRLYPELAQRAEPDGLSYRDFLALLVAEEVAHRAQTRIQRCVRRARFPFLKTIEEFDCYSTRGSALQYPPRHREGVLALARRPDLPIIGHRHGTAPAASVTTVQALAASVVLLTGVVIMVAARAGRAAEASSPSPWLLSVGRSESVWRAPVRLDHPPHRKDEDEVRGALGAAVGAPNPCGAGRDRTQSDDGGCGRTDTSDRRSLAQGTATLGRRKP